MIVDIVGRVCFVRGCVNGDSEEEVKQSSHTHNPSLNCISNPSFASCAHKASCGAGLRLYCLCL